MMKIVVVSSPPKPGHTDLLDEVFTLRARVFKDRLNWNVTVVAGRECDEFDLLKPDYIVLLSSSCEVIGTARLLPARGPTMLQVAFPVLLAKRDLEAHDRMVESSRFCIDTRSLDASKGLRNEATRWLFAGIIQWCMSRGFDEIVTATDLRFERLLRHVGWPMRRLGEPHWIGCVESIAGSLIANEASFQAVKPGDFELISGSSTIEPNFCVDDRVRRPSIVSGFAPRIRSLSSR